MPQKRKSPKSAPQKPARGLEPYRRKRDFTATPEPRAKKSSATGHSFVVQEHHARSHHYDFRLEMDGVLVSWAVPKGPPEDSAAKRLAVHVEDHPLAYGKFSGVIPEGHYGAGRVSIWDRGEWEPIDRRWKKSFDAGKLKFVLHGSKLKGTYLLARMKEEPNWLLRKINDNTAPEGSHVVTREKAAFVKPQLARVVPTVPKGSEWLHEIKYDGYRLIAVNRSGQLRLYTRNALDWTDRFEDLSKELGKLTSRDFVLDGEAIVMDTKGRSSFGALQSALKGSGKRIDFVVFDILHYDGINLRNLPLSERLNELKILKLPETGRIRQSKVWPAAQGNRLFEEACKNGLEGIISKRVTTTYLEDSRNDWVKSKCRARQEFVICGYTPPKNTCPAFGALIMGSWENDKLVPRGKVGTGFTENQRRELLQTMQPMKSSSAPFPFPERDVQWIEPRLIAEVEFAEITRDGSIRQGSFVSLREDKKGREVHLDAVQVAQKAGVDIKVAGTVISHPERMVYPRDGITKLEVASYFERAGEAMMPFVANRPLAVVRAPSGISGEQFFQKSFSQHVPPHVKTSTLSDGTSVFFIQNVKGLVSLAQFGMMEVHPWGAPMPEGEKPDVLVWDLDPDDSVPWEEVLGAARLMHDYLENLGLHTRLKTSGGKGLHVMLYLKRRHDWETARTFSKAVAAAIAAMNPKRFLITASKSKRKGKIYIDWLRNGRGATCVAPWCPRAHPGAPISRPVNWSDLPEITANGFALREPLAIPSEWVNIPRQSITKAILKEVGL